MPYFTEELTMSVASRNIDLIEQCDSDKETNDAFSVVDSNMLPLYYGRHGSEDVTSKRSCLPISSKNPGRRLIKKSGKPNIIRVNNPLRRIAYIRDFGNTLVNSRWKWTLLCFASSYVLCWLIFAVFYMLVGKDNSDSTVDSSCFYGITGFAGYFLLSLETQQTIGYGTRYITSNCAEAVFLISLQMITSIAICGAMTTIVYTKIVRPSRWRTRTLFSKVAVICLRDGALCLMFRIRDDDNKHGMGTKINAYLVQTRMNEPRLKSLTLEKPGLLLWPLEIVHKITPSSPFWDLSAKDLITYRFELIVIMQGTSLTTGQCSKTRSSYLASEILWGHRFKSCIKLDATQEVYFVDHNDFNTTEEVLTPLCSAQRLDEVVNEITSPLLTPVYQRSPVISNRFNCIHQDDLESMTTSSGIGSMQEEQMSPTLSAVAKKLSTIRELNSIENIAVVDTNVPTNKGKENDQALEQDNYIDDSYAPKHYENVTDGSKRATLDIEELVASLQQYLDENSNSKKNTHKFTETNF